MDTEEFRRLLRDRMEENRAAFEGLYKEELNALAGLSREEIELVSPDMPDMLVYEQLITVVKEASRTNLSQAELKARIKDLGEIAQSIARKVPSLATLLA